ncbi:MAG: serralysin [bacterium]|jgi:serralysin
MLSKERHQTATGPDTISGEGGEDSIGGGEGNDVLFGDNCEDTALGDEASPLSLNINNLRSDTSSGSNSA